MNTAQERSYGVLANEVWKERYRAKMNVDYYGVMAVWRRFWTILFNGISLVCTSVAAALIVSKLKEIDFIVILLIVAAAIASVINALSPWGRELAKFLRAQEEYRIQEIQWDILWHRLYAHEYETLQKAWEQYEQLRTADSTAEQVAQPHRQRSWLVKRIQKRLKQTEFKETENDGRKQTKGRALEAG